MPRKRKERIIKKHLDHILYLIKTKPNNNELCCQSCDREFLNKNSFESHLKTKGHKKRIKELKTPNSKQLIEEINAIYN